MSFADHSPDIFSITDDVSSTAADEWKSSKPTVESTGKINLVDRYAKKTTGKMNLENCTANSPVNNSEKSSDLYLTPDENMPSYDDTAVNDGKSCHVSLEKCHASLKKCDSNDKCSNPDGGIGVAMQESPSCMKVQESPSCTKVQESPSCTKVQESHSCTKVQESPSRTKNVIHSPDSLHMSGYTPFKTPAALGAMVSSFVS